MPDGNGFSEYKQLILHELQVQAERISQIFKTIEDIRAEALPEMRREIEKDLEEVRRELTVLKVKAALAGALFGALVTIITQILLAVLKR